ncbi:bifunctional 2-C-methyl-D-erythritol 4-phosphate cytidylyltransferase/2-C-methyl-D-erythritol 2,4-cyclodiphosphate synthase [Arvimicrobium flavum]|uniref:bifunctional 2-C-methyl-D-erythritol 4-phosphate cytidylyltransferase/2-C-methyl-D-erythritol 2,4-cyclodiphosphate synthase n=1 Tax=Arvimicrobium flavum TaxID=3393320 RepID=UPI00237B25D6|nr:bifunctional 2-C-methyl-D-erythritol 4-phosphate cytidylyltransferase/2-C-methyl-D-erythritol 2,4-cyclodiphosphate synthase [Mesorhizobium shangrilense]
MTTDMKNAAAGNVAVVIVAAGRGERAGGGDLPKQYRSVGGKTILRRSVEAILSHRGIGRIVVAIHPADRPLYEAAIGDLASRVQAIDGGASRQASVLAGLQALRETAPSKVLIHDAARPFVDTDLIDRIIDAVEERQAALPAIPVSDTLKRGGDGDLVSGTVAREGLFAAQTPQGFPFWPIHAAHMKADRAGRTDFTDDAAIAEWANIPVKLVRGSPDNQKLTWAKDIEMADQRLSDTMLFPDVRTGNGYDVHSFEAGDHVWLAGVKIPHTRKLNGHSDADVALHALTDALLATCGGGDIGTHFPPSDPQWKGAASHIFVEHAARLVREHGGRIANADMTLICEAPKIGPHREAMVAAVAQMLGIDPSRISVKATTNERLGFVGREEGIAAIATATVVYPGELPA